MAAFLLSTSALVACPTTLSRRKPAARYPEPTVTSRFLAGCTCSCSGGASSTSSLPARAVPSGRRVSLRCRAVGEGPSPGSLDRKVYQGVYGSWTVDPEDVREVILYRSGLVTVAACFIIAASSAFLPDRNVVGDAIKQNIDLLYAVGAGGLGLSLLLIHIYVTPIKRFLQLLYAAGLIGSLAAYLTLAQPHDESLIQYATENPLAIWFIGPLFASLTGLVFKEGLCYGKLEASILTFVIPALLLGHLSGLMDDGVKRGLLGLWMLLFVLFAARKFTQPIKDDIGDKSIFMFNALPSEEKKALVERLELTRQED